ncbi:polysaccharide deacetylase family protein [Dyella sp. 2HG41-7]|uniref:polysaccharide deacetylase family protein n=1 Tax=Dyella sp. 2HG41-7 TaxID=2883239 RepID=UPI001F1AFC13|nr:polysaccharide deacetylase family protein [Dyella sp. 2HG41-7]
MLLYIYRRHFAVCGLLLMLFLYALLLSGRGMEAPRFALDKTLDRIARTNGNGLRSVSDVLSGRKYALLTFDDGPYGYGLDEQIMQTLRKHHAHAVFFLVCSHINDANEHVLGEIESEGNLIGNHSYNHQVMSKLSKPEITRQIEDCNERIAQVTGKRPYYFRAPFGATSPLVADVVRSFGMKQMSWNANSGDAWLQQPSQIRDFSLSEVEDQSILLLHERPRTAAVLDELLTKLEERGYQFELPDQQFENTAID